MNGMEQIRFSRTAYEYLTQLGTYSLHWGHTPPAFPQPQDCEDMPERERKLLYLVREYVTETMSLAYQQMEQEVAAAHGGRVMLPNRYAGDE